MVHPGKIHAISEMESPSLVFFADRIRRNITKVLQIAGNPSRLWPHIKTHKTLEITRELIHQGVTSFKCATIAEAELLARAEAAEVLIAYPLVGPNVSRFGNLASKFENTRFSALVESRKAVDEIAAVLDANGSRAGIFVDLDVGMGRTGLPPDRQAEKLVHHIAGVPFLTFLGLHAYDGHNRQVDKEERQKACGQCVQVVRDLKGQIEDSGIAVKYMILGGTPTFPCYSEYPDAELSPGTAFLFDWGYGERFADLPFEPAAFVLGRVISRINGTSFTLDIGSKAIAADPVGRRGLIIDIPYAEPGAQSEEHWVFSTVDGEAPEIGQPVLVVPTHVCPTVNLYEYAQIINSDGKLTDRWPILARTRRITV